MSAKPILYSYYRSSCSWRVRAALALKGVDYDYKPINLLTNGQVSEDYHKINPLGLVPALIVNGTEVLTESIAIIEYIDEVYTSGRISLLPKDPILRAKVRAISETIVSGIQPLQNTGVLEKVEEILNEGNVKSWTRLSWAKYWVTTKFEGLEALLAKTSGKCCVGDSITIADLCLVPQVYNANRFGIDMKKFPTINRLNEYLLTIDGFKQTHPSVQPDCPPENK